MLTDSRPACVFLSATGSVTLSRWLRVDDGSLLVQQPARVSECAQELGQTGVRPPVVAGQLLRAFAKCLPLLAGKLLKVVACALKGADSAVRVDHVVAAELKKRHEEDDRIGQG